MERVYQKLVRDNIPDIISKKGEIPIIRILNDPQPPRTPVIAPALLTTCAAISFIRSGSILDAGADTLIAATGWAL